MYACEHVCMCACVWVSLCAQVRVPLRWRMKPPVCVHAAGCSSVHADGTAAPLPCGNVTVYCPPGSTAPTPVVLGYYTAPAAPTSATDVMAMAVECPAGYYCAGGVRTACPAGTYQGGTRRAVLGDCRVCTAGGFCPPASAVPTPCGNDSVYCPTGSSAPSPAGPGYFTEGNLGGRVARSACDPGSYCPGDGAAYPCPAGTYGDTQGLTSATCSGRCGDGVLCPLQTSTSAGLPCPAGSVCTAGLATACPSGTYNPSPGAANVSQCLACPAGTFNPGNGSSSDAECLPCPAFEGSAPGASSCWPGILGAVFSPCRHVCRALARAWLPLDPPTPVPPPPPLPCILAARVCPSPQPLWRLTLSPLPPACPRTTC
jgi:hypothetical protein